MMGIYELLVASDSIKQMIISRKSIAAIRKAAAAEGMSTLLQSGIRKVLEGETDLIEILSVCLR
jgi:type II secretory ATPase GspE/PulE/Tfp pilus assembly ATPase PilB-like protein